ncbi:MAG TPA: ABC transporter permease [Candidatus Polarisedimenticolia bacterium]|jgi:putative ABC transport system permease protein|nr:ABC transporter permease [Candidatus Polarisedimenticolia bacterium]
MKFFRLVWKNVFRKKTRAFLTIGSIVLVLVLIVVLVSLLNALSGDAALGTLGATRIVVQHATGLANFMPLAYRQKIEQVPGVIAVAPEIWFGGTYIDQRAQNFFGQLSTDPEVWPVLNADVEIPADQLKAWQSERDAFIAGQQLIDRYHWKLGDRIQIKGSYVLMDLDLVLRGIYKGRDESNIFFHNKYLENSWAGRSSTTGIFFLRVKTPDDVPRVTEAINSMFENSDAPVKAMPEKEFNLQFLEMMGNVKMLVRSISIIVLLTVVLITANTMAMSARERVTEIAVIRALGFRQGQVLALILAEAMVLAILGGIAGVAFAFPFTAVLVEGMKHSPVATFAYNFRVSATTILMALAASVAIGTIAGFVPAIRSSRVRIVDGLRKVV